MVILVIDKMVFSPPSGGTKRTLHDDYLSFVDEFNDDVAPSSEVIKQYFIDKGYTQEHALIINIERGK